LPIVSVIIPTYNRAHLLGNAIQSVLDQTFQDFEIIVVDDGSTDNSHDVAGRFGEKVIYIRQEHKERSAARNNGMKHARGKYITFLDSDDLFLPEKLHVQVESMEKNPDYGMSYSYSVWMDENGKYLHTWRDNLNGSIFPEMMRAKHNKITVPSVMIRRTVPGNVGYFNESISTCEDYEYWCRIAVKYPVLLISKALVIINTSSQPSQELFYSYFTGTLSYYKSIFNSVKNIDNSLKRAVFLDLSLKYYLNASTYGQEKFIRSEIKKIDPSYVYLTIIRLYKYKLIGIIRKYNGISTVRKFIRYYMMVRLPKAILTEDMEYLVMKDPGIETHAEIINRYYKKNEMGDIYVLSESIERNTRKTIRDFLIICNYLHYNRIAMILNL
jgi:glycosyltransferase involved in cell wall biosynthesis